MARDHYVPRTYLRHFTKEFSRGERGSELAVYSLTSFRARMASINVHLANEEDFYDGHPIDIEWKSHETNWPQTVRSILARSDAPNVAEALIEFASIQYGRVPAQMEKLARRLAFEQQVRVPLPNQPGKFGALMGNISTKQLLDEVARAQAERTQFSKTNFEWHVLFSDATEPILTSDNPCILLREQWEVRFPICYNAILIGKRASQARTAELTYGRAKHTMVREFNRSTVRYAEKHIYVMEKSSGLPRFLQRNRATNDSVDPIKMGRTFSNDAIPPTEEEFLRLHEHFLRLRAKERPSADQQ